MILAGYLGFFFSRKSKIVAILPLRVEMFLIEVLQLEHEGNRRNYLRRKLGYLDCIS